MATKKQDEKFARTRAALEVYDAGEAARKKMWDEARDAKAVRLAVQKDEDDEFVVRDAFFEDTKDVNSRGHVDAADLAFIRKCAKGE